METNNTVINTTEDGPMNPDTEEPPEEPNGDVTQMDTDIDQNIAWASVHIATTATTQKQFF